MDVIIRVSKGSIWMRALGCSGNHTCHTWTEGSGAESLSSESPHQGPWVKSLKNPEAGEVACEWGYPESNLAALCVLEYKHCILDTGCYVD